MPSDSVPSLCLSALLCHATDIHPDIIDRICKGLLKVDKQERAVRMGLCVVRAAPYLARQKLVPALVSCVGGGSVPLEVLFTMPGVQGYYNEADDTLAKADDVSMKDTKASKDGAEGVDGLDTTPVLVPPKRDRPGVTALVAEVTEAHIQSKAEEAKAQAGTQAQGVEALKTMLALGAYMARGTHALLTSVLAFSSVDTLPVRALSHACQPLDMQQLLLSAIADNPEYIPRGMTVYDAILPTTTSRDALPRSFSRLSTLVDLYLETGVDAYILPVASRIPGCLMLDKVLGSVLSCDPGRVSCIRRAVLVSKALGEAGRNRESQRFRDLERERQIRERGDHARRDYERRERERAERANKKKSLHTNITIGKGAAKRGVDASRKREGGGERERDTQSSAALGRSIKSSPLSLSPASLLVSIVTARVQIPKPMDLAQALCDQSVFGFEDVFHLLGHLNQRPLGTVGMSIAGLVLSSEQQRGRVMSVDQCLQVQRCLAHAEREAEREGEGEGETDTDAQTARAQLLAALPERYQKKEEKKEEEREEKKEEEG
ncbi:hypothetical protein KIPB_006080 [Kipferlia bialata]|uniref:Uncharacterized protein n=1 Tax=Kipferlia bialata TaxID=797122 RepID=A0A9K3CY04_9EUKA|nr:hypothetical protein KIPB_006080 [Kipferlia bialata]|eukprot:g6080.t1